MKVEVGIKEGFRIMGIARVGKKMFPDLFPDELEVCQALSAAHNVCALDLQGLLHAPKDDLRHDLAGIMIFMDQTKGKFTAGFMPRYVLE